MVKNHKLDCTRARRRSTGMQPGFPTVDWRARCSICIDGSRAQARGMMTEFAATAAATGTDCPSCGRASGAPFYEALAMPTSMVRLLKSRAEALDVTRGDIRLHFCDGCGLIWNGAFDPRLIVYEEDYEASQAASPTFNRFHERLARDVIGRYGLSGRTVLEVGCGQGEFLALLCDIGGNTGIGFDPTYRGGPVGERAEVVADYYSEEYAHLRPDFLCCKMTLEHIPDVHGFLAMLRRALGDRRDVTLFLQVPEVTHVLAQGAFWDIYYEHCSYFSPGALARAVRAAGFAVSDLWTDYGGQYLMVAGRPDGQTSRPLDNEEDPATLADAVRAFAAAVDRDRARWRRWLEGLAAAGRKVVVWGGGSKAVGFLTTIDAADVIEYVVDINPRRRGTYIAGSGQEIVTPDFLSGYTPDVVVVMNPIYRDEIAAELRAMGLAPEILAVDAAAPTAE